jgi:hypothetical protein
MTTGTTVVRGNNTVTNKITTMAITIFVVTSTTVTYILALNKELGTLRPMKLVGAWSTIWFMAPRVPSSSPRQNLSSRSCGVTGLHLSCVKVSTISKRTKMSFHLCLIC